MGDVSRKALRIAGRIGIWLLTVLAALFMFNAGTAKFARADWWIPAFESWGYSASFAYFIGGAEALGALLLLVPRTAAWAASGLAVIMLGALYTVLVNDSSLGPMAPLINLALLAIVFVARWRVRLGAPKASPEPDGSST